MLPQDDYTDVNTILKSFVEPWYKSLENPPKAQEISLLDLLKIYSNTDYGSSHNAQKTKNVAQYQANFPIINYENLRPYLKQVKEGNHIYDISKAIESVI